MSTDAVIPSTGEVMPVEHLAVVYANAREELDDQLAEVNKLRAEVEDLAAALAPHAEAGPIDAGNGRKVVLKPARRGSQRVLTAAAEKHREVLIDMGGGHIDEVYRPPNITWVRDNAAELVARGIAVDELAPEPIPAPPTLTVVSL